MNAEFKIQGFDAFVSTIYNKFMQSALYEFTNRNSNVKDLNYGNPYPTKPDLELSKDTIKSAIIRLLIQAIDYYLLTPNVTVDASYNVETNQFNDIVGQVLQEKTSSTIIDTKCPVLQIAERQKVNETNTKLALQQQIGIEQPIAPTVEPILQPIFVQPDIPVNVTPDLPTKPIQGGGGGGSRIGGGYNDGVSVIDKTMDANQFE